MIKMIDSQAVLDNFWVKRIHIGKWCSRNGFNRRTFYMVVNNEIGVKSPDRGRATRHIRAALERDGLMVYLPEDEVQNPDALQVA